MKIKHNPRPWKTMPENEAVEHYHRLKNVRVRCMPTRKEILDVAAGVDGKEKTNAS